MTVQDSLKDKTEQPNPYNLLISSESKDCYDVRQIQLVDGGSQSQLVHVIINGVPADGVINMGADITIAGQELFARVATVARLQKNFRKPNKVP